MRKFKCLLCGNETGYNLIKMRTRNSEHNIVACTECGLQQLYPLPSLEEDKKHYDLNPHDKEITLILILRIYTRSLNGKIVIE